MNDTLSTRLALLLLFGLACRQPAAPAPDRVAAGPLIRADGRAHPGEPLTSHPEILLTGLFTRLASAPAPTEQELAAGVHPRDAAVASFTVQEIYSVQPVREGVHGGFKLSAIRPGSLLASLGFSNGDTVMSLNGIELKGAEDPLEANTKLRNARHLTVEIERRGQPVTLEISVGDKQRR